MSWPGLPAGVVPVLGHTLTAKCRGREVEQLSDVVVFFAKAGCKVAPALAIVDAKVQSKEEKQLADVAVVPLVR